jgi:glycosyltransferase involved in cell wall biosynthesis
MSLRESPLISIIIASYNHAPYVVTAVTSVLQQDLTDIEVIVVDDGSDDGTPDIVEKIKDTRLSLIRLNQNRRIHPRNLGLRLSSGRYIAFQNSDDEWLPDKLSAQIKVLEKNRNVVACFTGVKLIDENGKQLSGSFAEGAFTTNNRKNTAWLRYFFDAGNCLCLPSAIVRRSDINSVGQFRSSLIQLSDLDLWVRLAAVGDFHIIDTRLTRMRIIPDKNLSRPAPSNSRRSQIEYSEVLSRYTERPVINHIDKIFNDVIPRKARSTYTQMAGLALYAMKKGNPSHVIFADKVLSGLIDNYDAREEIVNLYGAEIVQDFIKKRGEIDINIRGNNSE